MMSNLFSSFDPTTSMNLSLNWMSTFLGMTLIPMLYWFIPSRMNMTIMLIMNILYKEFKMILNKSHKGMLLMMISLFMFILMNNFLGLFPYIFTSSSHMIMTMTLSIPMWMSFMMFGWINNTNHMFAHMVPNSTPKVLMPFMVCIETISNLIRPGTLAIRLSANMIAGHLLLTLMGSTGPMLSFMMMNLLILAQILLLTLEFAVSIIQSYVFSILSTLYSSEIL